MIEKNVEAAIIAEIDKLKLSELDVVGLWQPTAEGIIKAMERSDSSAVLIVKIPPKSFDTFGVCEVTLQAEMALTIRVEKDAQGNRLLQYAEPINALLERWNMCEEGDELEGLITDDFYAAGVHIDGGTGPTYDATSHTWSATYSFTIRGLLRHDHD